MKTEHTYKLIYDAINSLRDEFPISKLRILKKLAHENYFIRHLVCGVFLLEKTIKEYKDIRKLMTKELEEVLAAPDRYTEVECYEHN